MRALREIGHLVRHKYKPVTLTPPPQRHLDSIVDVCWISEKVARCVTLNSPAGSPSSRSDTLSTPMGRDGINIPVDHFAKDGDDYVLHSLGSSSRQLPPRVFYYSVYFATVTIPPEV